MKRFLIFSGVVYYPVGGMHDFKGDFGTLVVASVRAREAAKPSNEFETGWSHVYDTKSRKIVAVYECRDGVTKAVDKGNWEYQ